MGRNIKILSGIFVSLVGVFALAVACSKNADSYQGGGDGTSRGGSMARFTISGDYLYTVDNRMLKVVSLKGDPAHPWEADDKEVGMNIETIFTMGEYLFIGSQDGMYVYGISTPSAPYLISHVSHFKSCDPVVASGDFAFVTLNSEIGSWCGNTGNALQIYDISDIANPRRILQYNNVTSPRGLAVDEDNRLVFVCDNGMVRAFNFNFEMQPIGFSQEFVSNDMSEVRRIDAYDCIALDPVLPNTLGTLLVIGADGLYQLGYDTEKFTFISKIDLRTK